MQMTNEEIYLLAMKLEDLAKQLETSALPIKAGFYIFKNVRTLTQLGSDIEQSRLLIGKKYGELSDTKDNFAIRPDCLEQAAAELENLMTITQEVNISKISLDELQDIQLTGAQIQTLLFMIKEDA